MTGSNGNGSARVGTDRVKQGLAQMLKGGVIVSMVPNADRVDMCVCVCALWIVVLRVKAVRVYETCP